MVGGWVGGVMEKVEERASPRPDIPIVLSAHVSHISSIKACLIYIKKCIFFSHAYETLMKHTTASHVGGKRKVDTFDS